MDSLTVLKKSRTLEKAALLFWADGGVKGHQSGATGRQAKAAERLWGHERFLSPGSLLETVRGFEGLRYSSFSVVFRALFRPLGDTPAQHHSWQRRVSCSWNQPTMPQLPVPQHLLASLWKTPARGALWIRASICRPRWMQTLSVRRCCPWKFLKWPWGDFLLFLFLFPQHEI